MSLGAALDIGRSGLVASQAAIQVAGNNLANAATKGYHRQTVSLAPAGSQQFQPGITIGRGVTVQQVVRQIDVALENRIRGSIADESGRTARQDVLSQIESIQNELSGNDVSTYLGKFFDSWSELANRPTDNSLRSLVVQQGQALAGFVKDLRTSLVDVRNQADTAITSSVTAANDLLNRIANLGRQIVQSEGGNVGTAQGLRDQRDALLGELSGYLEISTVDQPNGSLDVYVGSLPVIMNDQNRGLEIRRQTVNGRTQIDLILSTDGSVLPQGGGKLGSLVQSRAQDVNHAIDVLDDFAGHLIYEVNKVHSSGQGSSGFTSVTGTTRVSDPSAALNSAASGLEFTPTHGSFEVLLKQKSTGLTVRTTINIDLDGINPAADTSINSLVASLNGVSNLSAALTTDGRLKIDTVSSDFEVSFADDNSGALAALGVNTYFTGSTAEDIGINSVVSQQPGMLAAGKGGVAGDNRNALALSNMRDTPVSALGGVSISEAWNRHVEDYAVRLGQAKQQAEAASLVKQNLEAQQQSVSGVNTDEEAINLLAFQRSYQASARFLTVVDEMMQTLLSLVS